MTRERLASDGFERLLSILDPSDRERAGARYEDHRASLIRFFRWRGCETPEELADEVMTRASERAKDDEAIRDIGRFLYGIARFVMLESHRRRAAEEQSTRIHQVVALRDFDAERRLECLDACLAGLPPADRDLIVGYYDGSRGEKIANRQKLARALTVSLATLRVRAYRIRERLEACLHRCIAAEDEMDSAARTQHHGEPFS